MIYYRIDWDAINGLPPAARLQVLADISTSAQRACGAERVRIVHTEIERAGGGHGSQKAAAEALGLKQTRTNQIAKESPMTVTISTIEPAELHHQYPGQNEPQPCFVEVDLENRHVHADWTWANGMYPLRVAHGIDRRYPIPPLTSTAANELLTKIRPLAERMVADWERVWDGSNIKGVLGDDARAAEQEIETLCAGPWEEGEQVSVWDAHAAINGDEAEEYGITANTPDERLKEIEEEILTVLRQDSASDETVLHGVAEHLKNLRDNADDDE